MTAIYIIDDLKPEVKTLLLLGKIKITEITQKDIPENKRRYFYTRKYKGDRIEFHYKNEVKVLNQGI